MQHLDGLPPPQRLSILGRRIYGALDHFRSRNSVPEVQQYLATLQWAIFPPISYSFNRRTHRLFINSNTFNGIGEGDYLVFECDVKPSPDVFPDVWNDMFLKQLACAYVQLAWGRVLTKYQQVQLPGGITMNGDQIYNDAKQEIAEIKERFALDYADYPLDIVG